MSKAEQVDCAQESDTRIGVSKQGGKFGKGKGRFEGFSVGGGKGVGIELGALLKGED